MITTTQLNVLPLGGYDVSLGINWLYMHQAKVDCYEKNDIFLDEKGKKKILQGNKKTISVRLLTAMQIKHSCRKGCTMFARWVSRDEGIDGVT